MNWSWLMNIGDVVEVKGTGRVGVITDITFNIYRHMIVHVLYAGTGHVFPHYTNDLVAIKRN